MIMFKTTHNKLMKEKQKELDIKAKEVERLKDLLEMYHIPYNLYDTYHSIILTNNFTDKAVIHKDEFSFNKINFKEQFRW